MLIADCGSDRVLEYVLSGGIWGFLRVVLPASPGVVEPCGLALAPDGRLTVTGCSSHDVVLVDLTTLAVTPLVAPGTGGLGVPMGAVWSGSTLLVASANANDVIYFDSTGHPTGVRARGVSTALDAGIAFSPDGQRLLIVSSLENEVVEHDAVSGELLRTFGAVCGFLPVDVAYGPDGRIYVACSGDDGISRIDPATGQSLGAFVLGGSGGLFSPRSLAFGPDGHLYVSSATGDVLEYDGATGGFLGVFVDPTGNGGGPVDPYGLAFHQGKLYVASFFPSEVKAFDATTGAFVSTFVTSGAGGLSGPTALDFGPDGDLYVTSLGQRHDPPLRGRRRAPSSRCSSARAAAASTAPSTWPSARARRRSRSRRCRARRMPRSSPASQRRRSRFSRRGRRAIPVSRRGLVSVALLCPRSSSRGGVWWFVTPREAARRGAGHPAALRPARRDALPRRGDRRNRDLEAREEDHDARGSAGKVELPDAGSRRLRITSPSESARALDGLALEAWKQSDLQQALNLFEQAVAADPDDRVPRSHLGRLLTLATDYDAARPHLERAAALAPEDPQVWLDLQSFYERALLLDLSWEARARAESLAERPRHHPGRAGPVSDRRLRAGSRSEPSERASPPGTNRARGPLPRRITLESPSGSADDGRSDAPSGSSRRD